MDRGEAIRWVDIIGRCPTVASEPGGIVVMTTFYVHQWSNSSGFCHFTWCGVARVWFGKQQDWSLET